ncbi:MAG: F0F1 ATP synthase subunit delta [Clostridia bacterium]
MKERIIITVPGDFGEKNLDLLKSRIEKMTGDSTIKNIQVVYDEALIGGFVVRMRNRVYDASLKTRLEQVKEKLATGE